MTRKEKTASKQLDIEIDKIYRTNCSNIAIDIFDVPRVFAVAREAHKNGFDMKNAIMTFVDSIRRN